MSRVVGVTVPVLCSQLARHLLSLNLFFLWTVELLGAGKKKGNQMCYLLPSRLKVLYIVFARGDAAPPTQGHQFPFWGSLCDRSALAPSSL